MIERWLQITCNGCGETDNSMAPNLTIKKFLSDYKTWKSLPRDRHFCVRCVEVGRHKQPQDQDNV